MPYSYEYPRPALTVDMVVFMFREKQLKVLLIQRKFSPFKNRWAFPGGFLQMNETLEKGAQRELEEETGIQNLYLEQLYTFSKVRRDPRGRVITVAYLALIRPSEKIEVCANSDAKEAEWFNVYQLPHLAFDHNDILIYALERLRNKLDYTTVGFQLLEEKFSLTELQETYEVILQRTLDKRNFRKKILKLNILNPLEEYRQSGASRPARLYELNEKKFIQLRDKGILFPFH
jgi:8-oxo-dGTP diphosphatase